ncbi:MAG: amidohydrolase family protein [Candidatus Latescibacterota bacterium]
MIVDVHAHVLARPVLRKSRTSDLRFMSAEEQVRRMDEKGIAKAVILPLTSAEVSAEKQSVGEVLEVCDRYPGRFIPFCDVDPRRCDWCTAEDFRWALEQYREAGCRGLGEVTARLPFDDPRVFALFSACEQVGFPVTFHTAPPEVNTYGLIDEFGLPRFEKALQQFPDLTYFGHSAAFWSEISGDLVPQTKEGYPEGPVTPGGTLVRLFRQYPSLHGDLSAGSGFNMLTRDPAFTYEFADEFQDRLLLGLDHTDATLDFQHIEWLQSACQDGHISAEALDKILWRNADRILGLGLG